VNAGQAPTDALRPDQPPSAAAHHQFAVYLADAYTQTVTPAAAASYAAASCRKPRRASGGGKTVHWADLCCGPITFQIRDQLGLRSALALLTRNTRLRSPSALAPTMFDGAQSAQVRKSRTRSQRSRPGSTGGRLSSISTAGRMSLLWAEPMGLDQPAGKGDSALIPTV
jgi:hypothetical protein